MTVTFSTAGVALAMGVNVKTVNRLVEKLQGRCGRGHKRRLTPTDVKIIRAWHAITERSSSSEHGDLSRQLRALARETIEADPRRYLVLQTSALRPPTAHMVDTVEAAVEVWDPAGRRLWWLIDLEPGE